MTFKVYVFIEAPILAMSLIKIILFLSNLLPSRFLSTSRLSVLDLMNTFAQLALGVRGYVMKVEQRRNFENLARCRCVISLSAVPRVKNIVFNLSCEDPGEKRTVHFVLDRLRRGLLSYRRNHARVPYLLH